MLLNDVINEAIQGGACLDQSEVQALRINPPETRHKVRDIEGPKQRRKLLKNRNELLLSLCGTGPESGAVDDAFREVEHRIPHVNGVAHVRRKGADDGVDFVSDGVPGLGVPAAEEFDDADFAHLAPEGSVVSEGHVGAVVG